MLPAARSGDGYRIAVVCTGNICRSPVADVVLNHLLSSSAVDGVTVESFGTGGWHVGDRIDSRSGASLTQAGYDGSQHRARQFTREHAEAFDLVLAMDAGHHADLARLGVPAERLALFRTWDPAGTGDVPDPYYGGAAGFADVLAMVERTSDRLVAALEEAQHR